MTLFKLNNYWNTLQFVFVNQDVILFSAISNGYWTRDIDVICSPYRVVDPFCRPTLYGMILCANVTGTCECVLRLY